MSQYKCISCGEIKESEKNCCCPVCGYRMFETPYVRKDMLLSEIKSFLALLESKTISREDLVFEGKSEDEERFPDCEKILKYVSSRERTEDFLNHLLETAEQLKLHFTSDYSNTYPILFENLDEAVKRRDALFYYVSEIIAPEIKVALKPVVWEKASLLYSETQNKYLWSYANELLSLIEKLAKKIVKFIKFNNLYGNLHKYYPQKRSNHFTNKADSDYYKDEFENAIYEAEKVLCKEYTLDIIDDGSSELKEMLTCLWRGIELIMSAPLFTQNYDYITETGKVSEAEFFARISDLLKRRYADVYHVIQTAYPLDEKSEEELFALYKKMIGIDQHAYLVPVGTEPNNVGESEKNLSSLIGLSGIKESIQKIKAYALTNKDSKSLNLHMCFIGNPGTGKTEVARHIAGILYENKILPTNKVIEVDRSGLVSQYFGATAEKTSRVISSAMGGVLFVDEAYALGNNSSAGIADYGKEAIDTLVKAMEDYRGKFCVIFAGYKNEMLQMLSTNPGFKSRIQFFLDFPNYSRDELKRITELMLSNRQYTIHPAAMERILDISDIKRKDSNFANAREIRNILDQIIMCQNLRTVGQDEKQLGLVDVNNYIKDAKINLPTGGASASKRVLTGEEELAQLIGLVNVKQMVKKIKAYAKRNKDEADFNMHMCFYGNPGTGKTEVARILSRILYDANVLDEAKLVETDSLGLLGKYVGETAPKTEAKINEAMNGVLFIDEAYGLLSAASATGGQTNYGEEAITVLLKEMEDRRGQLCVIFAGYKDEMQTLLAANPGFASRIQFTLDFPDYTRDELGVIAKAFLSKKKYEIETLALERLLDIVEYYRELPNFVNARTVRNVINQVLMNQNLRTENFPEDCAVILEDVNAYLTDEGIDLAKPHKRKNPIGFA